jgi:tRNA (guanine37-N1)-methyltransferase
MKITIMTLFPEMVTQALSHSILGRAQKKDKIIVEAVNIRDFAFNKHKQVDDYPYGGGAGMLMMAEPIYKCYEHILATTHTKPRVIYMTPQGKTWNQSLAREFAQEEDLIILCGHYEGIDQRVLDAIVTDEVSIGDYVLTGGELAAMVVTDSIVRLIPGVLGKEASFEEESFSEGLLEYPQYTRPAIFLGKKVPEVLLSGNHQKIADYRKAMALCNTFLKRPDLLENRQLTPKEKETIRLFLENDCINNKDML